MRQFTVIGMGDSDGDGMDDVWEFDFFKTLARDGTQDFDNDGSSDLAEFLAGTLPNDPGSLFQVLPTVFIVAGAVTVQWHSVPGKNYRLQFKNSLADSEWIDVPGDVSASGPTASKTDSPAPGQSARFYRVEQLP